MALLVTSAPDPAVVGTATNLQNLLSIAKSETWIFCCNFLVEYRVFDREYRLEEKENQGAESLGEKRGRETAEYLKSQGYMSKKKDKEEEGVVTAPMMDME